MQGLCEHWLGLPAGHQGVCTITESTQSNAWQRVGIAAGHLINHTSGPGHAMAGHLQILGPQVTSNA